MRKSLYRLTYAVHKRTSTAKINSTVKTFLHGYVYIIKQSAMNAIKNYSKTVTNCSNTVFYSYFLK